MSSDQQATVLAAAITRGATPDVCEALDLLSVEMLTDSVMREAYSVIELLRNNGCIIDLNTVTDRMESEGAYVTIATMCKNAVGTSEPVRYARHVATDYACQKTSFELESLASELRNSPISLQNLSERLSEVNAMVDSLQPHKEPVSVRQLVTDYVKVMYDRYDGKQKHRGIGIGLDLNINRTDLVVIGGTPGMGKTALALFIADHVATNEGPVLVFSLEMEDIQLVEREISKHSGAEIRALKDPVKYQFHPSKLTLSVNAIKDKPIFIDDSPLLTLSILRAKIRRFKENNPELKAVFLDYLQLMKMPNAERRDLAVGEVSRNCKLIAKELKTPIFLLSQMNRDAPKVKREPEINDLRDSGAIEQDADKIIFPYREEVYFPDSPNAGLAKVLKRKTRDDTPGAVLLEFRNGNFYEHDTSREWHDKEPGNGKEDISL